MSNSVSSFGLQRMIHDLQKMKEVLEKDQKGKIKFLIIYKY